MVISMFYPSSAAQRGTEASTERKHTKRSLQVHAAARSMFPEASVENASDMHRLIEHSQEEYVKPTDKVYPETRREAQPLDEQKSLFSSVYASPQHTVDAPSKLQPVNITPAGRNFSLTPQKVSKSSFYLFGQSASAFVDTSTLPDTAWLDLVFTGIPVLAIVSLCIILLHRMRKRRHLYGELRSQMQLELARVKAENARKAKHLRQSKGRESSRTANHIRPEI
eukprot:6195506-Pleurochrysis_carterae.AAC.1